MISLVAGLLSVYFACILQQQLSSLHNPEDTRRWLTIVKPIWYTSPDDSRYGTYEEQIIPSCNAAILLVVPSILLNWSSISLLIGIGIYYGLVHAGNLGSLRGNKSNLAIFLVYVLFTVGAVLIYVVPLFQKVLEVTDMFPDAEEHNVNHVADRLEPHSFFEDNQVRSRVQGPGGTIVPEPPSTIYLGSSRLQGDRWGSVQSRRPFPAPLHPDQTQFLTKAQQAVPSQSPSGNIVDTHSIIAALQVSIAAHKASLQAQEALLQIFQASESLRPSRRRASF